MKTFRELMKTEDKTETEKMLLHCIATISTQPGFTHFTPEEVYMEMKKQADSVGY